MADFMNNSLCNSFWDRPNAVAEVTNYLVYNYYRTRLINAYLSRLEYENLTTTSDVNFFETTLMLDGTATILQEDVSGDWYTLGYTYRGNLNVYRYPTRIRGVGYGQTYDENSDNTINYTNIKPRNETQFAIAFDNPSRTMPLTTIDFFARQLWEIHTCMRSNLNVQHTPYIIAAPQKISLSIKKLLEKLWSKEKTIELTTNTRNIEDVIKVLDLKVDYKANDMMQTMESIWNQALAFIGVMSETDKKERLLSKEASMNQWENQLNLVAALKEREKALDWAIRLGYPGNPNVRINALPSDKLDFKVPDKEDDS